jgi:hypothetical protein
MVPPLELSKNGGEAKHLFQREAGVSTLSGEVLGPLEVGLGTPLKKDSVGG